VVIAGGNIAVDVREGTGWNKIGNPVVHLIRSHLRNIMISMTVIAIS